MVKKVKNSLQTYGLVETEEEKGFEVMVANAVAKPGTVMVHLWHTDIANAAMMSSLWLPIATLLTVHLLVRRGSLRNHLRSFECRNCV